LRGDEFRNDGGDQNHQLAIEQVIVAAYLFPKVVNAACGVDFLLAALGGDLLEIIAPRLHREGPVTNKAHQLYSASRSLVPLFDQRNSGSGFNRRACLVPKNGSTNVRCQMRRTLRLVAGSLWRKYSASSPLNAFHPVARQKR